MKIIGDVLEGENIKFVKTPNTSGEFKKGDLDTIIMHYTAGPSAKSAVRTLTSPKVRASAHLVVERDGSITQLAPFNIITWHAGRSEYKGRTGFNQYSIGIEMVNAGPLTKSGNKYRAWYGTAYDQNEVIEAIHRNETQPRYWHVFTPEQIQTVNEICSLLISEYNIQYILGHEEIAPRRKTDPGPAFPLDRIRTKLLAGARDENKGELLPEKGRVIVNKLNIRERPKNGEKIAKPLTKGTIVNLLEEKDGWYRVTTEIEGWVYGKYIGNL